MPSIVWPTFAGSMSNAVVIFNFRPRPLKYLVMAWPRCPMPMTAMLVTDVAVEDVADEIDEHLHVVALLRVARKADEHQVAAHLHRRDAVDAGQHVGEDVGNPLLVAGEQRTAVLAQPFDRFFRGYWKMPWSDYSSVMV